MRPKKAPIRNSKKTTIQSIQKRTTNIFISWSGDISRQFANHFKNLLVTLFKENTKIFLSHENISKGEEWLKKISNELKVADICFVIITSQNLKSEWLNFEAGAISFNKIYNKLVCPILVNIDQLNKNSPLNSLQITKFEKDDMLKMLRDVRKKAKRNSLSDDQFTKLFEYSYPNFENSINNIPHLTDKKSIDISDQKLYPLNTTLIEKSKVFLGAPMASTDNYNNIRVAAISIKEALEKHCDPKLDVYYPGFKIKSVDEFDGKEEAIALDFKQLKSSEFCFFIYPEKVASSILLEIGYAIATMKNIVIFTKSLDELPFMLQFADKQIAFVKIYTFHTYDEIVKTIKQERNRLFNRSN